MNRRCYSVVVFFLILCVSVGIHRHHILSFPKAIHSWSQTDHLAIAHGFVRNDFNFFLPESYQLNKNLQTYDNAITAVDFPIVNYLAAAGMKLSGSDSAASFRIVVLMYACVGLTFLFLFLYHRSHSYFFSAIGIFFVFGSAVYLDYQDGLIPSMPALSSIFIAVYSLDKYWRYRKLKSLAIAVLFLCLAALVRLPHALFLIALAMESIVRGVWKKQNYDKRELLIILSGFILPVAYFLYNGYLREIYGTLFLAQISPALSSGEIGETVKAVKEVWWLHYWSVFNYILIFFAIFILVLLSLKRKWKFFSTLFLSRISVWLCISFGGGLAYAALMFKAFYRHDYYFLDSFFVVVTLLSLVMFLKLFKSLPKKRVVVLVFAGLTLFGFNQSLGTLEQRRKIDPKSVESRAYDNFQTANKLLERLGIEVEAKILSWDSNANNLPLIVMKREAYSEAYPTTSSNEIIFNWDWEYLLLQDYRTESLFIQGYPDVWRKLKRIGGDGNLSVYVKRGTLDPFPPTDVFELFHISERDPFYSVNLDVEEKSDSILQNELWQHLIDTNDEFSNTITLQDFPATSSPGVQMVFEMDYSLDFPQNEIFLVTTMIREGELYLYEAQRLNHVNLDESGRCAYKGMLLFPTPKDEDKVQMYFWNPNKNRLKYKNLVLRVYAGSE